MARVHGRNGICYMSATNGAAASPVAFLTDWSINFTTDKVDVTAMGDPNHIYVVGLPDASGDFSGWYDDATLQTYTAAVDGLSRNFYLYPNVTGKPGNYFFGTVFPDFAIAGGVTAGVSLKATWSPASIIQRVG